MVIFKLNCNNLIFNEIMVLNASYVCLHVFSLRRESPDPDPGRRTPHFRGGSVTSMNKPSAMGSLHYCVMPSSWSTWWTQSSRHARIQAMTCSSSKTRGMSSRSKQSCRTLADPVAPKIQHWHQEIGLGFSISSILGPGPLSWPLIAKI
jgi:hypothetical protein